ncbi:unnamed protein product [Clonostachys rhizophaga]|uniref:Uncharacterized protein n=1 Tax=Clonostachys rhizophaga TaxID=160324 RepID=A0A9N9VJ66_9HYPO|nr:unnamed protein product [Clonostachys rhizophaga]
MQCNTKGSEEKTTPVEGVGSTCRNQWMAQLQLWVLCMSLGPQLARVPKTEWALTHRQYALHERRCPGRFES